MIQLMVTGLGLVVCVMARTLRAGHQAVESDGRVGAQPRPASATYPLRPYANRKWSGMKEVLFPVWLFGLFTLEAVVLIQSGENQIRRLRTQYGATPPSRRVAAKD